MLVDTVCNIIAPDLPFDLVSVSRSAEGLSYVWQFEHVPAIYCQENSVGYHPVSPSVSMRDIEIEYNNIDLLIDLIRIDDRCGVSSAFMIHDFHYHC